MLRDPRPIIAHVLHRLYLAGAEVLAADLARRLSERYRFVFFCLDEIGPLGKQLADEGFTVVDLMRKPGVDRALIGRFRGTARGIGVRLLHAHQYTPFFYASASRLWQSTPRILFTEHGRHYPDRRSGKRVFANRFLLRRDDRVTAVGNFVRDALVKNEGIAGNRVEVVYNGIDPSRFNVEQSAAMRGPVRAELGLAPDQQAVLQVARFHPVKDHATAIRAFAIALKQAPSAVLLLAGDGDKRGECESLVKELGIAPSVRFLGVRNDVPRLMAAADLFVLSSLSEGISVTLLEAMGSGVPIVTTDVGGNGEVVSRDETGLLSPRGDHAGLGANMATLLLDAYKRKRFGLAGRERLMKQFTQEQMHARYEAIYAEMLAQR